MLPELTNITDGRIVSTTSRTQRISLRSRKKLTLSASPVRNPRRHVSFATFCFSGATWILRHIGRIVSTCWASDTLVDETSQMHVVPLDEVFQDLQRTDLLPLDRRIRQALSQEQEIGHQFAHSRPKCSKGNVARLLFASASEAEQQEHVTLPQPSRDERTHRVRDRQR